MSAWEFSPCGFGCGSEDKDEHPSGCSPSCLLSSRATAEHLWESHCSLDGREEEGISSVSTPQAFAALSTLYPIISQDNNAHLLLSKSPPLLDIISPYWQIVSAFSCMFV